MGDLALSRHKISVNELKLIAGLPILLDIESSGLSAVRWAKEYQEDVRSLIEAQGALLIRGLKVLGSTDFSKILTTLFASELLEYVYRSTPRTQLRGNVYTATEYPARQVIPQHNENSYSRTWPNRLGFLCLLPAETGGETPIGDSRIVYDMLPESVRSKFEEKGRVVRSQWLDDNRLRTIQVNPATTVHPHTGEKIWFNQAHLFHVSSLGKEVADTLLDSLGEENLPRNSYYGDGSRIEPEVLDVIRRAYEQTKVKFRWQKNDLLLLDNTLFTHGREPYTGTRKVLVGMACPNRWKVSLAKTPFRTAHYRSAQEPLVL